MAKKQVIRELNCRKRCDNCQAFTSEKLAPPFGIYIHESARTVGGLQGRYYFWRRNEALSANVHLQSELKEGLISFFGWEKDRSFYFKLEKTKFEEYY